MREQRHRARPRQAAPTPGEVLGPAVGVVVLLLLLALVVQPNSFRVRIGRDVPPVAAPTAEPVVSPAGPVAASEPAPTRTSPEPVVDQGAEAMAALSDLLLRRDAAVASGDAAGWTATSGDPTDGLAPAGSFVVLSSLPVTRFESSLVPDTLRRTETPVAGAGWQAQVETLYELADSTTVVRTDLVALAAPEARAGWRVVSWTPHPATGDIGTQAPWDLGEVVATTGERGVVLSWADPAAVDGGSVPPQRLQDAQAWGGDVLTWVDRGAVVVDSYLGTGWPRTTIVLAPATTAQYDALVPGPAPGRPDVFAAVTTDARTAAGAGDLVVLNPTARSELAPQTWQVTVTHELVHVASGTRYGDRQEVWLAEGMADLVGWSTVVPATVTRQDVAGRLLERVRTGEAALLDLPDGDAFSDPDVDVVGDAYEGAWLAALLLQDELGVDGLLAVYEAASDGDGSAQERTDAALREATGEGRDVFRQRWVGYLTGLAAG